MRDKLVHIFNYLNDNSIKYFLLRPIDFTKKVEDIDLVISRNDFRLLLNILANDSKDTYIKYSNAHESIQLFIDDILLLKSIAFLILLDAKTKAAGILFATSCAKDGPERTL